MAGYSLVAALLVAAGAWYAYQANQVPPLRKPIVSNQELVKHSDIFKRQIINVTDSVHLAIGYGLANSILFEGPESVVIVDCMESLEAAEEVKRDFDLITGGKRVEAIIYTHNHADHTFGAKVFAGDDNPDIYGHESLPRYLDTILSEIQIVIFRRAMRQFGSGLPEQDLVNSGIGPMLRYNGKMHMHPLYPNKTFKHSLEVELAGFKMVMVHAPGETNDQIVIHLPELDLLVGADNYYHAFPNLYAIRGTSNRNAMMWARSLDKMRAFQPETLLLMHSLPLHGRTLIEEHLRNYRDAIQFVHDQTVRFMNLGLSPNDIVERLALPPQLADLPYLREFYGTVEWSVRGVFDGYLGWFSGDAVDLTPLPSKVKAERMIELGGGGDAVLARAQKALAEDDIQWALELAEHLLLLGLHSGEANQIKIACLRAHASRQISANGRNYYLTAALEAEGQLVLKPSWEQKLDMVSSAPMASLFRAMACTLNAEKAYELDTVLGWNFQDSDEKFSLHIRNGIADFQPRLPENPDIQIALNVSTWKDIVTDVRNPVGAYGMGLIQVEVGSVYDLANVLLLFEPAV